MILALLVAAFVFFLLGAFLYPSAPAILWYRRPNWISLGLACWVLTEVIAHWPPR